MPLINGCKYSCEPCIRGHRATSCAHTDRILIEVRKPGRPLESCGHNLNTCQCGRLAESFLVGDVLPNPSSLQHLGAEPDLAYIVTTPPQPSSASSRKSSRSGSTSKVSKRTSRKKAETSLASSARNRGSREPSTLTDDATETDAYETSTTTSSPGIQEQGYTFQHAQNQTTFQGQSFQQGTQYLPPITGSVMQNDYLQYQGTGNFGDMRFAYGAPSQQQFSSPSSEYSSRIEDVRGVPPGSQEEGAGGTEIRSQYILATQDTVWRAAP